MNKFFLSLFLFCGSNTVLFAQTVTTTTTTTNVNGTATTVTSTGPAAKPSDQPEQKPATTVVAPQLLLPVPQQTLPAAYNAAAPSPAPASGAAAGSNSGAANAAASGSANASNIGFERYSRIKIDFTKGVFEPYAIPFDVPFIIYGPIPKEIKRIVLAYTDGKQSEINPSGWAELVGNLKKPAAPNPPPLTGSLNISAAAPVAAGTVPATLTGLSNDGTLFYQGAVDQNANIVINGELFPKSSRDAGTLEWTRNYLNTSSSASVQDYFYFIVPPLKALTRYKFFFTVYRTVSASEATDLNAQLRPAISKYFKKMQQTAHTASVEKVFSDPANADRAQLIGEGQKTINRYYNQRDISVSEADAGQMLQSGLDPYIQTQFLEKLLDKEHTLTYLEQYRTKAWSYSTDISHDQTLDAVVRNASGYGLVAADLQFIQRVLQDLNELQGQIAAQPGRQPIDLTTTPSQLQAAMTNSSAFINKVYGVYVYLLGLRLDATKLALLKKEPTHPDLEKSLAMMSMFVYDLKSFYGALVNYFDASVVLENNYAAANIDFVKTVPLTIKIPGMTTAEFVTRGEWYITADLGFAGIRLNPTNKILPYLGVNFNLFPINRQANYSLFNAVKSGKASNVLKGVSIVTGLTLIAFKDKDQYTDLFGNTSLLTGLGLRLTDGIRLTYGRFWSYQKSANPLLNQTRLVSDPYLSLSLDWDLRSWLKNFGKQINGFTN